MNTSRMSNASPLRTSYLTGGSSHPSASAAAYPYASSSAGLSAGTGATPARVLSEMRSIETKSLLADEESLQRLKAQIRAVQQMRTEIDRKDILLREMQDKNDAMSRDLQQCLVKTESLAFDLNNSKGRNDQLMVELQNANKRADAASSELAALTYANAELRAKYDAVAKDNESVYSELSTIRAKTENLLTEFNNMKMRSDTLANENKNLRSEMAAVVAELKNVRAKHDALFSDYNRVLGENGSLKSKCEELYRKNESLFDEVNALNGQLNMLKGEHTALQQTHAALKNDHASLSTSYQQIKADYGTLSAQYASAKNEYAALGQQHSALKAEHASLGAAHSALQHEHDSLNVQHDTLRKDHEALSASHGALKVDHASLSTRYDALRGDQSQLSSRHETLVRDHVGAKSKIDELQRTVDELSRRNDVLVVQLEEARGTIRARDTAMERMRAEFERQLRTWDKKRAELAFQKNVLMHQFAVKDRVSKEVQELASALHKSSVAISGALPSSFASSGSGNASAAAAAAANAGDVQQRRLALRTRFRGAVYAVIAARRMFRLIFTPLGVSNVVTSGSYFSFLQFSGPSSSFLRDSSQSSASLLEVIARIRRAAVYLSSELQKKSDLVAFLEGRVQELQNDVVQSVPLQRYDALRAEFDDSRAMVSQLSEAHARAEHEARRDAALVLELKDKMGTMQEELVRLRQRQEEESRERLEWAKARLELQYLRTVAETDLKRALDVTLGAAPDVFGTQDQLRSYVDRMDEREREVTAYSNRARSSTGLGASGTAAGGPSEQQLADDVHRKLEFYRTRF